MSPRLLVASRTLVSALGALVVATLMLGATLPALPIA